MLLKNRQWTLLLVVLFLTTGFVMAQKPGQLPDNVDTADCTSTPPAKSFDIKLKWETKQYSGQEDPHINGCSTPLVADMDGDGFPEIVAVHSTKTAGHGDTQKPNSFISRDFCVLNGKTGEFKYMIKTAYFLIHGQPVAVGDVDHDGCAEIFIVSDDFKVYCYKGNKANANANDYKWIGHSGNTTIKLDYQFIPMLADVNNDGVADLVCGGHVFNAITGACLVEGKTEVTGRGFGSPHNVRSAWNSTKKDLGNDYYLNALADMDGDNQLELCAGNTIYKFNISNIAGSNGNSMKVLRQCEKGLPYDDMYDGQTVVLDFDNDGDLDVCVFGRRSDELQRNDFADGKNHIGVYVWEGYSKDDTPGDETKLIGYFTCDNKTFSFSIPFAGDLNGDGFPELVVNSFFKGYYYNRNNQYTDQIHVFTYQKGYTQNSTTKASNIKEMFNETQSKQYASQSGFTVFDFNQDSKSEIVYRDHGKLYIIDGTTLTRISQPVTCYSGNTAEYPIVADVDCDGHADIIVTSQYIYADGLQDHSDNDLCAGRIQVFESNTPGAWGPARKIWNQWAYNVVNINEDGSVPQYQFDVSTKFANGKRPFNAFLQQATRLNIEGDMYAPAADALIKPDTAALTVYCDSITLDVTFTNDGTQPIYAPYGLTLYADSYKDGEILFTKTYDEDLEVNDEISVHVTYREPDLAMHLPISQFVFAINDIGQGISTEGSQQSECDTTNNILICPFEGFRLAEYDTVTHHMCYGDEYTVGEHTYTETGEYTDTLLNRFGCDSIVTSRLFAHSISVDLGPDQRYCSRDYVPVTLNAGDAAIYEWQDGSAGQTFVVDEHGGKFMVKVYDDYGCSDSDSVTVTIIQNPELYITQDPEDFCATVSAVLTAHVNTPDATFLWSTGEITPSIAVTEHGYYSVTADNDGCTSTDNIQLPECPCEVWMPNAFSPNGDGLNEYFKPQVANNLESYQLQIFNRWGELIFTSNDPDISWDGTYKGKEVSSNVFTYILNYVCSSNSDKKIVKRGIITLVR